MEYLIKLFVLLPFIIITTSYILMKNKKWYLKYPIILLSGWLGYRLQLFILLSYIDEPSELISKTIELEKLYIDFASWIPTLIFLVILQIINSIFRLIKFTINKTSNKSLDRNI